MPIGITDEHSALHEAARGWAERHCGPSVAREQLEADREELPAFWEALAGQGWLGLHVNEAHGGSGYGVPELAVVVEELGRAATPGPFLATVLAAAAIQAAGNDDAAKLVLPGLASGETPGAVALGATLEATTDAEGVLRVSGVLPAVLSGALARVLVVAAGDTWCVLLDDEFQGREEQSLDLTRRVAQLTVESAVVPPERQLVGLTDQRVRDLSAVLFGADAVGGAHWCIEAAAAYAKDREQFGRPIGQFQGVKHRCADMLARTELGSAAVWDAAHTVDDAQTSGLTAAAAAALAVDGFAQTAKDCVQVHGGIGFTWEHDAHIYLRRAVVDRQLVGRAGPWRARAAQLALEGVRRRLTVDLPPDADDVRAELRAFLEDVRDLEPSEQRRRIADAGYIQPQWPKPWGRDADAVEQLVIDEEFRAAKIIRPSIMIGGWALPPLMVYGTQEQQERWIPPTLRGEIDWCQLFSEPGAGSDLAGLSTRAERVEGGWVVNGQKVWTSSAQKADWGFLVARTDPDAPKHQGISFFMVDMRSPGIDVRPLRELTGQTMFNEVFFNDVFVPDDCLVGREHDGWRATRTSLANERVFMGSGSSLGAGLRGVVELLRTQGLDHDDLALAEVGGLVVTEYALSVLGFRLMLRSLAGADPSGSEASVRKLLGVEHDQRVQEVGLGLLGPDGAVADGEHATWGFRFLFNRALTIAGGTSEIQRNIIAERVLGLPKDP